MEKREEHLENEIDKLAKYLMERYPSDITEGSAVDVAIKILSKQRGRSSTQVSHDGKHWEPAKQEPYYPMGIEWLKCTLGFHELVQSKKYAHTKYCSRCGKRKTSTNFEY